MCHPMTANLELKGRFPGVKVWLNAVAVCTKRHTPQQFMRRIGGLDPENGYGDRDQRGAARAVGKSGRDFLAGLDLLATQQRCNKDADGQQELDGNLEVVQLGILHLGQADQQQAGYQLGNGTIELPDVDGRGLEVGEPAAEDRRCTQNVQEYEECMQKSHVHSLIEIRRPVELGTQESVR